MATPVTELDGVVRLLVAAVLGALLGIERELTDKPAGLRTHMLVSEGAALFMVASILITQEYTVPGAPSIIDPTRIGSTIVTGVGFLGGGLILQSRDRVLGLTTAAAIWVAAAIGMLVGAGHFLIAAAGTLLGLFTLYGVRRIEQAVGLMNPEDEKAHRDEDETSRESGPHVGANE